MTLFPLQRLNIVLWRPCVLNLAKLGCDSTYVRLLPVSWGLQTAYINEDRTTEPWFLNFQSTTLTLWSRLIANQLPPVFNTFSVFYRTWVSLFQFTRTRHWTISRESWIHFLRLHEFLKIHFNTVLISKRSFPPSVDCSLNLGLFSPNLKVEILKIGLLIEV